MHGRRWHWGMPFSKKIFLLQEQGQNLGPTKYTHLINNPLDPGLLFTGHNETPIINSKLGVWEISISLKFSHFLQN